MKWTWKIGEFFGIGVYLHTTFLLLIGWILVSNFLASRSLSGALAAVAFVLALFLSVVLHEYGHALTARRFGIATRDITLLPIGGVARLERMPADPRQELWVSLAGPAVNVVIAAVLSAWLFLTGSFQPLSNLTIASGPFLERLMIANLSLVLFNLIPAFPMDGGRVLRALLAIRLEYSRATAIAATVGQGLALLLGAAGLFANPLLILTAVFIWMGASQEAAAARLKSAASGIPVSRAMLTHFHALSPRDTLARAVDLLLAGSQTDFPVVQEGRLVGMLTRAEMIAALLQRSPATPVGDVMQASLPTVEASALLESASLQLQGSGQSTLPVLHQGVLVGLLTQENIAELMLVQSALGRPVRLPAEA